MKIIINFESLDPRLERKPQEIYPNCSYYGQALADFLQHELNATKTGKRTLTVEPITTHGIKHLVHLECISGLPAQYSAAGQNLDSKNNQKIHRCILFIPTVKKLPFWAWKRKKADKQERLQTGRQLTVEIRKVLDGNSQNSEQPA